MSTTKISALVALIPIALVIFLLIARIVRAVAKRAGASAETLARIDRITRAAVEIVRDLNRTVVADAKDPATPSTWSPADQRAVKDLAMARLRAVLAPELRALATTGADPERVAAVLDQAVEASVTVLKSSEPFLRSMELQGELDQAVGVVAAAVRADLRRSDLARAPAAL